MGRLSKKEVAAKVIALADKGVNRSGGDVSTARTERLKEYRGLTPEPGRKGESSFRDRSVFEAVEWTMPHIVETFLADHRFLEFRPTGPEDEERAAEETDVVLYHLRNAPDAFVHWLDFFRSTLIDPVAYGKVFHESWEESRVEEYTGLDVAELLTVLQPEYNDGGEVEPLELTETESGWDARIRCTKTHRAVRFLPIPAHEVRVDPQFTGQDLDEADYVCHVRYRSRADLLREGVPARLLDRIAEENDGFDGEEETSRLVYSDTHNDSVNPNDAPGTERFKVHEMYGRLDVDGDGFAERRKIVVIGGEVYKDEEEEYQPFLAASAVRIPHVQIGMGYAEMASATQEVKSAIMRQILNNAYAINDRRVWVDEALFRNNPAGEAQLENARSRYVKTRGSPQGRVLPDPTPNIVGELAPLLGILEQDKQRRVGVTPGTGVDPDMLQRVAADAHELADARANSRLSLLVRTLAETAVRTIALKGHQLIRRHYDRDLVIKLRNKWTKIDPTSWRERTDVDVMVGLGHPSPQRRVGLLMQILAQQKEAMAANLATPAHLFATFREIIEAAELGHAERFFADPTAPGWQPPQPPPPNPVEMAQAQALGAQAQKFAAEAQQTGRETEIRARVDMAKVEAGREKSAQEHAKAMAEIAEKQRAAAVEQTKVERTTRHIPELHQSQIAENIAKAQKLGADADATENAPTNGAAE